MKVCTDSCLFGAWIISFLKRKKLTPQNILDIGTGTGLLSLMLAQETNAFIDAIEIEENACQQANENFQIAPWHSRLKVIHSDINQISLPFTYDCILSNPPFYENNLRSSGRNKNLAKHGEGFNFRDLLLFLKENLKTSGYFFLLLPWNRSQEFIQLAQESGYYLSEQIEVRQTPKHSYFRSLLCFTTQNEDCFHDSITIRDSEGHYTCAFQKLLKNFYLNL